MTQDDHVYSRPNELRVIADSLRDGPNAPPQAAHDALVRFLMGHQPAGLPHEDGEAIDFASSIIVARSPEIVGQLVVTEGIEELGPIIRDGVLPPYMHGPDLKLPSDVVTDPLLQRAGCRPVCAEAGVQHIVQLLLALPPPPGPPGLSDRQQQLVDFADDIRSWAATKEPIDIQLSNTLLAQLLKPLPANAELARTLRSEAAEAADQRSKRGAAGLSIGDVFAALELALERRSKGETSHIDVPRLQEEQKRGHGKSHWIFLGAGDLSFNEWNVALMRSSRGARTIIPPGEPFSHRRYRCLVGWNRQELLALDSTTRDRLDQHVRHASRQARLGHSLAMLELEFSQGHVALPKSDGFERQDITQCVDFAVFGKSVLWDGQSVPKHQVAEQFRDVRHLFALPRVGGSDVYAFGQKFTGDFWLLERALLEDANLLRLACLAPIEVPLDAIGVPQGAITAAFTAAGYTERERPSHVETAGQLAWAGGGRKRLHVFLRPAAYPCSMIALGNSTRRGAADADALYCLAWGHGFERGRFSLWEDCAAALQALGATHALVLDEGEDVFQAYLRPSDVDAFCAANYYWEPDELARRMPVPFAFDSRAADQGERARHYKRPLMRATLNFRIDAPRAGGSDRGAQS